MLSDEEKKAIEHLKNRLEILHNNTQWATENSIKIVLNLIEKQSKEIEELKEEQCCMTTCLRKDKEKLFLEDKIKAKIEELENQKRQWIEDRDNKHKDSEIIYAIEVLQSLLEKE